MSSISHVSDTAYWVATYRAQESARPDALFRDPLAQVLVGESRHFAHSMKANERYSYWSVIMRTRVIDQILASYVSDHPIILNLGAGLDTRPYRLDLPAQLTWIEIDFPHTIEMKNEKLKSERPKCTLERLALDLSDRQARRQVLAGINARGRSIWPRS